MDAKLVVAVVVVIVVIILILMMFSGTKERATSSHGFGPKDRAKMDALIDRINAASGKDT